jgi:hypothetical protein
MNSELQNQLRGLQWFASCGKMEGAKSLADAHPDWVFVDRDEAMIRVRSQEREDEDLSIRNGISDQLRKARVDVLPRDWNRLSLSAGEFCDRELKPQWEAAIEPLGLNFKEVLDSTRIRVIYMFQELAYGPAVKKRVFNSEYFEVYKAGRMPCGWDPMWPGGKLVFF